MSMIVDSDKEEDYKLPFSVKVIYSIYNLIFWGTILWLYFSGYDFLKNSFDERSAIALTVIIVAVLLILGISVLSSADNICEEERKRKPTFVDQLIQENCSPESIAQYNREERLIKETMMDSFILKLNSIVNSPLFNENISIIGENITNQC